MNWPQKLARILQTEACVVVTLNRILGSAPRESGSRLLVTSDEVFGSIGGGNLEFTAIRQARELLQAQDAPYQESRPFGLGPKLNQCCGGAVTLNFELLSSCPGWVSALANGLDQQEPMVLAMETGSAKPIRLAIGKKQAESPEAPAGVWRAATRLLEGVHPAGEASDKESSVTVLENDDQNWWIELAGKDLQPLILFGAGHVGKEVARLLERLPFEVTWVDSRKDYLPESGGEKIHPVFTQDPVSEVATAPPNSVFVVMTHSHELDENLCLEILQREDFAWLGLIGSKTKHRRFLQRLNKRGIAEETLARLVCPIGLVGIRGKQPATIALSLVAQLMMEQPWTNENN